MSDVPTSPPEIEAAPPTGWRRPTILAVVIAVLATFVPGLLFLAAAPASAAPAGSELPTNWSVNGNTATGTTASGVTVTATLSGSGTTFNTANYGGFLPGRSVDSWTAIDYGDRPSYLPDTNQALVLNSTSCYSAPCGTLTFSYSRPVQTPVVYVSDMGGQTLYNEAVGATGGTVTISADHPLTLGSGTFSLDSNGSQSPGMTISNGNRTIGVDNPGGRLGQYQPLSRSCGPFFGCGAYRVDTGSATTTSVSLNIGADGVFTAPGAIPARDQWLVTLGATPAPTAPAANADLSISKTGPATVTTNGTVNWALTVHNNGPTDSPGFTNDDGVPSQYTNVKTSTPGCSVNGNSVHCSHGPLANGADFVINVSATAPGSAQCLTNGANVIGQNDPNGGNNNSTVQTCVVSPPPAANADLSISKTGPATVTTNGTVNWALTVHNNGPTDSPGFTNDDGVPSQYTNVKTSTPGCSVNGNSVHCSHGPLANGADFVINVSATAPGSAQCLTNGANVIGQNDPNGGNNNSTVQTCVVSPPPVTNADLSISKTGPATVTTNGTVNWVLTVHNNGPTAATGFQVYDGVPAGYSNPSTTTPGCAFTGTTLVCSEGPLANGADFKVNLSAKAPGSPQCLTNGASVASDSDGNFNNNLSSAQTCIINPDNPSIAIEKSSTTAAITAANQTVPYTFKVTNTGNVSLSNVTVADAQVAPAAQGNLSAISCPATSLAAGASFSCTATYTVTQADLDNGQLVDKATATGTPPSGSPVTSPEAKVTIPVTGTPSIKVEKSSTTAAITAANQTVPYTFKVTNTGNVSLTNVTVADTQVAPAVQGNLSAISCPATSLAPNASFTCTASYTVTSADVANGQLVDKATATGTPPSGSPVTSPESKVTIPVTGLPSIAIEKSSTTGSIVSVNQVVPYSFKVTNTGNVSLTNVKVDDTQVAPAVQGNLSAISCPATSLAPSASFTCTATYTVTAADLGSSQLVDKATATGTPPSGSPVTSPEAKVTIPVTGAPSIAIEKSSTTASIVSVNQVVPYSFKVTNTGNVSLTNVKVDDTQVAPAVQSNLSAISCPATSLAPNASFTCTASYTVTAADLGSSQLVDKATATGTPPGGSPVTSPEAKVTIPVSGNPSIKVEKSSTTPSISKVNQVVAYSFKVTNTGNVALTNVTVNDTQVAPAVQGNLSAISCPGSSLAPSASFTCTASYTVTQADLNSGQVVDKATATGTPPSGSPVTSPESKVTIPVAASISLLKIASLPTVSKVGDVARYIFFVTSTSDVPLTNVTVTDVQQSPAAQANLSAITCDSTTLTVGGVIMCSASYTVTAADIANGVITDTAVAHGTPPASTVPVDSAPSTAIVTVVHPSISVQKSSTTPSITAVNQVVPYSFKVTNTGDVTLNNVTVNDTQVAPAVQNNLSAISCPATSLAPSASFTCTASYTVTAADVGNGQLVDTATATGTPPGGSPVTSPESKVTIPVTGTPSISIQKWSTTIMIMTPGQPVSYSFKVTNTGNVALTNVAVNDTQVAPAVQANLSAISCPATTLAPGATFTCTATYKTVQADLDNGQLVDTATATGTPPSGSPVTSPESRWSIFAGRNPAIKVEKKTTTASISTVNQVVPYSFKVTNTGNVTLNNVTVNDTQVAPAVPGNLSAISCPATTLAPSASFTCTANYKVAPADLDNGKLVDTATATGTPPGGSPVTSPPSTVTVPVAASIGLSKVADQLTVSQVGDVVGYSFIVTNLTDVPLTGVNVTDVQAAPATQANLSGVVCDSTTLGARGTTTCHASYTVTAADVTNGVITDTAVAHGTPPASTTPVDSGPSTAIVTVVPPAENPSVSVEKSSPTAVVTSVGMVVRYNFKVTNTGDVTLSNISVADVQTAPSVNSSLSPIRCPVTSLDPGISTTCTANYTVSQEDAYTDKLTDTATATGTSPAGTTVTSVPSVLTIPVRVVGLQVSKVANPSVVAGVGAKVVYTFVVRNIGGVALSNVNVTDVQRPPALDANLSPITCTANTLAVRGTLTCTATYIVSPADVANGVLTDAATAHGTPPGSTTPVDSPVSVATVTVRSS